MQSYFYDLFQRLCRRLQGDEVLLARLFGETSDFVRLNHNQVRQAGQVEQIRIELNLILGQKQATAGTDLSLAMEMDLDRLESLLLGLRAQLGFLPEDPYLNYATQVRGSEQWPRSELPETQSMTAELMRLGEGLDLVGLVAAGSLEQGFANSLGQYNWHSSRSFNLDWSCHLQADKAVKTNYAGTLWDSEEVARRIEDMRQQLAVLEQTPVTIPPGRYRVYLAPSAMEEIMTLLAWGGFGLDSLRTAETPLLRMTKEGKRLHPSVTLVEANDVGLVPGFTGEGFIKPGRIDLIRQGAFGSCLTDARSAKKYGAEVNADEETPQSLEMAAGDLPRAEVLRELGDGLFINHLWYGNFSDRNDCRITGMTRFACFLVEQGAIKAPLNVMRFDDSIYHLLGDRLLGLTRERDLIYSTDTYEGRSNQGLRLPGALIEGMKFTL